MVATYILLQSAVAILAIIGLFPEYTGFCVGYEAATGKTSTRRLKDDLMVACMVADVKGVESLLDRRLIASMGISPIIVNRKDHLGRTALMMCGMDPQVDHIEKLDQQCAEIAQLLITAGYEIRTIDSAGWSALAYAASQGLVSVCKALLEHDDGGVGVHSKDNLGRTPLFKAVANGQISVVKLLLEYSGNVNDFEADSRMSLLHVVANKMMVVNGKAVEKYVSLARLLLENGANPNARDKNQVTPMMYAAKSGNRELIKLLEGYGSDLDAVDGKNLSVVDWASSHSEEARSFVLDLVVARVETKHDTWIKAKTKQNIDL